MKILDKNPAKKRATRMLTVRITEEMADDIEKISRKRHMFVSQIVSNALAAVIKEELGK